jgi:hypothetical protein
MHLFFYIDVPLVAKNTDMIECDMTSPVVRDSTASPKLLLVVSEGERSSIVQLTNEFVNMTAEMERKTG